jgi:hypothetical protein
MQNGGFKRQLLSSLLGAGLLLMSHNSFANGAVGEHVNHLSEHLDNYTKEVIWLNGEVKDMIKRYQQDGVEAANTQLLVDNWEAVDFHSAIETNYVPVYASIWQGLFAVKGAIEAKAPISEIREQHDLLEQALWQGLGAVKMAAMYQQRGLLESVTPTETTPANSLEALNAVETKLNRVVAKYAEQLPKEATEIIYRTYMDLFEGVEGELISLDAGLVESLEKDFNVTLPQAIEKGTSVDNVRTIVNSMQDKIGQAIKLLKQSNAEKKAVF